VITVADRFRSIVIEEAMEASRNGQSPPPAYFYCSRNTAEPARSRPEGIIRSLVRQLSSLQPGSPIRRPAMAIYRKREAEGFASGSLRMDESRDLLIQLVKDYSVTTIIIDAVDECDPSTRADLLDTLEAVLREALVKIFISSRNDMDITYRLEKYPKLELTSGRNGDDIEAFVKTETKRLVSRGRLLRYSSARLELTQQIFDQVTKRADGM
jgi:hypothetical protein